MHPWLAFHPRPFIAIPLMQNELNAATAARDAAQQERDAAQKEADAARSEQQKLAGKATSADVALATMEQQLTDAKSKLEEATKHLELGNVR